jgi:hydrogenase maturation protein HypF
MVGERYEDPGALAIQTSKIILSGVVQGVGFRPFIYRHARSNKLKGWVRNCSGRVEVHVQGDAQHLDKFLSTLIKSAPPLSQPVIESVEAGSQIATDEFLILPSQADGNADIHLPADLFTCDDCLQELNEPTDRRYRYPFINCTQCGPRYTLIKSLPYDRVNTSMSGFPLCTACNAEYIDPENRRYHAEPVACPDCGPVLTFSQPGNDPVTGNEASMEATITALSAGKVLAVKGIGGYHLVCDARSDAAVRQLRDTKPRADKPLAILLPAPAGEHLQQVRKHLLANDIETQLLESHARPIVLIKKKSGTELSDAIAPGLNEIGAMLPYSPLHHLLLNDFGAPLIATSANISGEPVLTDNTDVEARLSHVADAYLHHNRPIVRPADDPVVRVINLKPAWIRQGRGLAPVEIDLPFELEMPVLAVGAHMKNTVTLAWDNRAVISPHIGEMDSPRSLRTFEQCIADLQGLYQVTAKQVICDAHPGYAPSRWAQQQDLPVHAIYHHHAHAGVAYADALSNNADIGNMLVFTWDGVGLGPDGTLWGGEALYGSPGAWQRVASLRPFKLPGGERAGREPWRSAAAICWESEQKCPLPEASDPLLYSFWQQGKNAPVTTAAGRLFDAAAALCGVCTSASFEGQGPMQLEALAANHRHPGAGREVHTSPVIPTKAPLSSKNGIHTTDWSPLIPMLTDASTPVTERAAGFHLTMAHILLEQAKQVREDTGVNTIGLAGGVFQNRLLAESGIALLSNNGFQVSLPLLVPVNDAGISFGQVIEYGFNKNH